MTQLQHAQQAAQHAKEAGGADHVILGAFLHDIGHLIGREKKLETVRVRIKTGFSVVLLLNTLFNGQLVLS